MAPDPDHQSELRREARDFAAIRSDIRKQSDWATRETRRLVVALADAGIGQTEAGELLGLKRQQVHTILTAARRREG